MPCLIMAVHVQRLMSPPRDREGRIAILRTSGERFAQKRSLATLFRTRSKLLLQQLP